MMVSKGSYSENVSIQVCEWFRFTQILIPGCLKTWQLCSQLIHNSMGNKHQKRHSIRLLQVHIHPHVLVDIYTYTLYLHTYYPSHPIFCSLTCPIFHRRAWRFSTIARRLPSRFGDVSWTEWFFPSINTNSIQ